MTDTAPHKLDLWIVEDNLLFQKSLQILLEGREDMECRHIFSTCEEAIDALDNLPAPDIILHDIGFDTMNGITSVGIIKKKIPQTQIIMITVFEDNDSIFAALAAGATGYLIKSATESVIIQAIIDVSRGGSPMSPSIARKVIEVFNRYHDIPRQYGLTTREREILQQIVHGQSNKAIADHLHVSPHTIDAHLRNIYEKLQVHTRTEATAKALKERLV